MIAIRYNDKNYSFSSKESTQNFCLKELKFAGNVNYTTDEEFAALGFQTVIDEVCNENQHLGDLEYIDGKFYRFAVDNPILPPVFDIHKFKEDIKTEYGDRRIVLAQYWGAINDNLKTPMEDRHYTELKSLGYGLKQIGAINQSDLDKFILCFANQGINLNNY